MLFHSGKLMRTAKYINLGVVEGKLTLMESLS
jgi:hypothetical protein